MSLLHFPDDNCTLKWRISDSDILFQASNIHARTWSSCKPPLFPALSDSLCILHKTHCHRLCFSELLKLVSKSDFMFYEEVDRWGGEKFPLGQGHWEALTGNKSCRLSSASLLCCIKKFLETLFLPPTAIPFRPSMKSTSKSSLFHHCLQHHWPGYLFLGN